MNAADRWIAVVVAAAFAFGAAVADARQSTTPPRTVQPGVHGPGRDGDIYGWQLMTLEEREAFRERLRSARTAEERDRLRLENHAAMQERARERGVTLRPAPAVPLERARER